VVRGGLAEIEAFTMRSSELREKIWRRPSLAATLFDRKIATILRAARANANDAPTHNPRITKVYSVSFPVWSV
jgi:hypothetical protein